MKSPGHYVTRSLVTSILMYLLVSSALVSSALISACASSQARPQGKPLEYFQTYNFVSSPVQVRAAFHKILMSQKYEIQKEDPLQIYAINSEITSVELITFTRERRNFTKSVYAGEIRLTIDLLEGPGGNTLVSIRPQIEAVVGRASSLKNSEWNGNMTSLTSKGYLENEMLKALARELKEKAALSILVTRGIELEGGFTLKYLSTRKGRILEKKTSFSFSYSSEILIRLLKKGKKYLEVGIMLNDLNPGKTSAFKLRNIGRVFSTITRLFYKLRIRKQYN